MNGLSVLREKHYNAVLLGERKLHGSVMVFRVRPDQPVPPARPGQWLELGLGVWEPVMDGAEPGSATRLGPEGMIRRAYSLSSPILNESRTGLVEPKEEDGFEFFLSLVIPPAARAKRVPNLTGRLFCLQSGDRLFISGLPMGEYTLDPVGKEDDVLFLATGTGEAPHNAMIWDLLRRRHRGRIASVVSARHAEDLAYNGVHRKLPEMFGNYRYRAVVTRDPGSERKHLQDYLVEGAIEAWAGFPLDPSRTRVFVCGNPGMIGPPRYLQGKRVFPEETGVVELLEERGFSADLHAEKMNVHYERYW